MIQYCLLVIVSGDRFFRAGSARIRAALPRALICEQCSE